MVWEDLFKFANTLAFAGWLALLFLPRWEILRNALRFGIVGLLAILYSTLIFVYFFRVPGGGFATLAQVKALFGSDPVLLAGWVHYLAFDLFTGVWIAETMDERGMSRLLQLPVLLATFMFGPLGLLLSFASRITGRSPLLVART